MCLPNHKKAKTVGVKDVVIDVDFVAPPTAGNMEIFPRKKSMLLVLSPRFLPGKGEAMGDSSLMEDECCLFQEEIKEVLPKDFPLFLFSLLFHVVSQFTWFLGREANILQTVCFRVCELYHHVCAAVESLFSNTEDFSGTKALSLEFTARSKEFMNMLRPTNLKVSCCC